MSETSWTPPPLGSPCWIEIPAADVKACKEFYTSLFPNWKFKAGTEAYPEDKVATFSFTEGGLSGGITSTCTEGKDPGENVTGKEMAKGTIVYYYVDTIEETKKKAEELGATALTGKVPEGKMGFYMHFKDVAGNRFGVYEFIKA